ncbi:MAG: amino acid ABC transporter permease [Alicyclobacillus herbarius]|uniref:amino acid ABC transporter permease n=1 Tax=Alicyclobacillus herbarius TaxID=122960 RepID=UPI000413561E|nr:amino acid ABC transporter permease [Alicyclobacillus herbarius]MCL6631478.1 amino acid ABC transporter permease [Alicyclobacillus herbarius]
MNSWHTAILQLPLLLHGLLRTVEYSLVAGVASLILGLIAALLKLSRFSILRGISTVYVEVFRGTPLLVQIVYIVFALPSIMPLNQWFGQNFYPIIGVSAALALNEGAYVTEIVRAGILGVDRGQREAAESIGMTGYQTMRYIILPQAFKRMIPPLVNQFAQTIKDTSLVAPVGVVDLMYQGQITVAQTYAAFSIYTLVAALYFIVIFAVSRFANYLERRLQIDQR